MRQRFQFILSLLVLISMASIGWAEVNWQGLMFGDIYYVAAHHSEDAEGANGIWFRRIYGTLNFSLSDRIQGRLRLEMADDGDFLSKAKLVPFVKDAYLQTKLGRLTLIAGISGTPTLGGIESLWGYRHLEKTPLDLYKMGTSREFGLALKGGSHIYYHVMIANGNANSSESNPGKKFMGSLGIKLAKNWGAEFYADYEWEKKGGKIYNILQGLAGYEGKWGRAAILYANRHFKQGSIQKDFGVVSGFVVATFSQEFEIVLRYDKLLNEPAAADIAYVPFSSNAGANFFIAAFSYRAAQNVWIIPNLKYAFYETPPVGDKPGEDLYVNITFYWEFK